MYASAMAKAGQRLNMIRNKSCLGAVFTSVPTPDAKGP